MAAAQTEVRSLFDSQAEAMRTKDIDRLMSVYAPEIVYFDVVPPLQYVGSVALRKRFLEWFQSFESAIDMETRDFRTVVSGDIAIVYWLSRARGTLKNGQEVGSWVRATSACRWSDDRWVIVHEHVSWPVDLETRSAVMDLVP